MTVSSYRPVVAETDLTYAYRRPSWLSPDRSIFALETSGGSSLSGVATHPAFFTGFLTRPDVAAKGLRALAAVAASRYLDVVDASRPRDPVLTCDGDRLRCESFSACGGVYARLDVLPSGLDGEMADRGTTNIDIGETLRRMLIDVDAADTVHLSVGSEQVVVTRPSDTVIERRVPLPVRWLRGFAETQQIASTFEPRLELSAVDAVRFFRGLGRGRVSGWVVPAGRTWRLTGSAVPGSVFLSDVRRLEHLLPMLRVATRLRAYGPTVSADLVDACAAWEVELPGARFVVLLSPGARRGLSGEGAVLDGLAGDGVADDAEVIRSAIAFRPAVDAADLAEATGLERTRVRSALDCLATAGQVGFDLFDASHFHRELPFSPAAVEQMNPRMRDARALAESGAVAVDDMRRATVTSASAVYVVRTTDVGGKHCTCQWWLTHRGQRGPCKHVLATDIVRRRDAAITEEEPDVGRDRVATD